MFGAINRQFNSRPNRSAKVTVTFCYAETREQSLSLFIGFAAATMFLVPWLGQDFFPAVDAGQFTLHVRTKSGTRIEEVARQVDQIESAIRERFRNSS
jgi:multidrug efflux pump subunit AcrB